MSPGKVESSNERGNTLSTITTSRRLITATAVPIVMISAIIIMGQGSVTTAESPPPEPSRPTGLTATAAAESVQLSWDDPQDDSITHYKVLRRNTLPGVNERIQTINANTGSSATSYTDSTVEAETRSKYRIVAVNAEGQSRRSAAATVTTPAESSDNGNPPGQVQDANATQDSAESPVNISWASVNGATAYQVKRETTTNLSADPVITDVDAPTTSHDDSNTEYDTEYLYRVRADNDDGYGEWSDLDRITTAREPGTPAAPARVELSEADPGSVVITWQDPPGDEEVDGYRVYRNTVATNTDQQLGTTDGTTTTYTDNTVAEETWYTYWIVAHNNVGDSPQSTWQSIETKLQTPNVPHEPTGLSLSEDTAGEVVVAWVAPAAGPEPSGYKVYRGALTGDSTLIATVGATAASHTDTTVEADTWYRYYVKAHNDDGDGTKSRTRYIRTEE